MRKTRFWAAIAVAALMLVGIAGWVYPSHRPLEAKASTSNEAKIDTFSIMSTAKDLPAEEFEDFSLVFPSPVPKPINP